MGTTSILDIVTSLVVFGFLLLIAVGLNDAATENTYLYAGDLLVQENLVEVVGLLEYDFRKIGYCADPALLPDPSKAILYADKDSVAFLTDVVTEAKPKGDGVLDTMRYYTGPVEELAETPNPRDRYLYRVINGEPPIGVNLGVINFEISYFDVYGDILSTPIPEDSTGTISTMEITVAVENPVAYAEKYERTQAVWKQLRLAARNLRNR